MKLYVFSALIIAGAIGAAQGQSFDDPEERKEDCVECLEDIDDARDCLRECNNKDYLVGGVVVNSLLAECLDESGDFGSIDSLDELIDCCNLDGDCEDDLIDAQECVGSCLDACISDDANDYLDCIREETGEDDCDLESCLDGFLADDIEDEVGLSGSEDIFDLRSISNRIESIEEDDLEDCNLLADFVDTVCDIGVECCDACESELGALVNCLINDIVIPFVSIELNKTILSCPIDEDNCELDSRSRSRRSRKANEVTAEEAPLFNKAIGLKKKSHKNHNGQTKRDTKKEAFMADMQKRRLEDTNTTALVEACQSKMKMEVISDNITYATNNYMECVSAAAVLTMEPKETSTSAASAVANLVAIVFAFGTALLF